MGRPKPKKKLKRARPRIYIVAQAARPKTKHRGYVALTPAEWQRARKRFYKGKHIGREA